MRKYTNNRECHIIAAVGVIILIKWISTAAVTGILGSCLLQGFRSLVDFAQSILSNIPIPLPLWGGITAVIVGGIIYRIEPDAADDDYRGIRTLI